MWRGSSHLSIGGKKGKRTLEFLLECKLHCIIFCTIDENKPHDMNEREKYISPLEYITSEQGSMLGSSSAGFSETSRHF